MVKLEDYTHQQLKKIASKYNKVVGLSKYSKLNKDELIQLLRNNENLTITEGGDKLKIKVNNKIKITDEDFKRKPRTKKPKPKPEPEPLPQVPPKPKPEPLPQVPPKPKPKPKPEPKPEPKEEPKKPEPKPLPQVPLPQVPPKPKQDKKAYEFYNNLNDFLKGSKRQINYLRKNFNIDDKTIDNIFEGQEYKDFYPTPKECIDKFNIRCNKILEGTAGLGSVAFWLREKYPDLEIVANELSPDFIPLIKKFNPSVKVINNDFFKLTTKEDCIFLNPPFSRFGKGGKRFGGKGANTPFYFDFLFHALSMIKNLGQGYEKTIYFISPDLMKNQRNSDKGTETFFINEILGESKTGLKNIIGLMEKYGNIKTNEKEMKKALKEYDDDPEILADILDRNPDYGLKNVDTVEKIGTCKGFGGTGASASMYEIRIF